MDRSKFLTNSYPWVTAILFLLPWVYIQSQTSINSDVAWLSICAERLISGLSLSQGCFDTNPPLNILIYAPFIFISKAISVELHHVIFWASFVLAVLSTFITHNILKHIKIFDKNERIIITLGFLCAITIIPTIYFAERDHFIAMGLLPFILAQLCITYKYNLPPKLKYFTLIAGGVCLLIKPHFGLIPAFLFLHRAYIDKCIFKTIKSPDFIILSSLSIAYLGVIAIFFPDFINVILPDIINLYLPYNDPAKIYIYAKLYGIISLTLLGLTYALPKGEKRKSITMVSICGILSLIVFIIQMKGFTYHRLPFYSLAFPLGFLLLHNFAKLKSLALFIPLIFISSYAFSPPSSSYATHSTYKNSALLSYINEQCDSPCSYFITHENMDIVSQIAFYSGHDYATRFPAFWFQPMLKNETDKVRFASYIAEDITHQNPSLLLIQQEDRTIFEYYSLSPKFNKALSPYKKIDTLTLDRAYFYSGTKYDFEYLLTWDVYKKYE